MLVLTTESRKEKIEMTVKNLKEAQGKFVFFRDIFSMGASDYKFKDSGIVKDPDGNFIAYISYNGRVWDSHDCRIKKEIKIV